MQIERRTRVRTGVKSALVAPVALACALAASAAQPGAGQPPANQDWQPPKPSPQEQQSFAPETVDAFVDVFTEINDIRKDYSQQIRSAEDQETAQALQREAQEEMMGTVQASDITVDQYNAISRRMNEDQAFAQRIVQRVQSAGTQ